MAHLVPCHIDQVAETLDLFTPEVPFTLIGTKAITEMC